MKHWIFSLIVGFIISLLISCDGKDAEEVDSGNNEVQYSGNTLYNISESEYEAFGMKTGDMIDHTFYETVQATGIIGASTSGRVMVNSPVSGTISSIYVIPGQRVSRGTLLFTVESMEIIEIQQDYAESISLLKSLESEYLRQEKLFKDHVISEKEYLATESNYKSMQAKCSGLEAKLGLLNLKTDKVKNGEFRSGASFFAPISGTLTMFNIVRGNYIDPQVTLMEIIDTDQAVLRLYVFEKDIHAIEPGDKVSFYKLSDRHITYEAEILTVGKKIQPDTKAVECIAKLNREDSKNLVNETYVEAFIRTGERRSKALPDQAIISSEGENYIFVTEKLDDRGYQFKKVKVEVGLKSDHYTEIVSDTIYKNVLIEGGREINE